MNEIDYKKIVFVSNFLSPHQKPFCDEMFCLYKGSFCFIATKRVSQERIGLGYTDLDNVKYVVRAYEDDAHDVLAKQLIDNAEVVIIGSASDSLIINRLKSHKLTFKYSERILKKKLTARTFPRYVLGTWLHHKRFSKYPLYMLCASAFEAHDLHRMGCYKNKRFCWGYFPDLRVYDDIDSLINKKKTNLILWVGRLVYWKHPEYCVRLAEMLRQEGYDFKIIMIGTGELKEYIQELIETKGLSQYIQLLGSMSPDAVRDHMELASIYLVTSNRSEGWGAVLNEAMNSACAVVAGSLVGAVPYLVEDGKNGIVFKNEDLKDFIIKVKSLLDDARFSKEIGKNAYFTIATVWNHKVAARNLFDLIVRIENGGDSSCCIGPCSPAPLINDDWYMSEGVYE